MEWWALTGSVSVKGMAIVLKSAKAFRRMLTSMLWMTVSTEDTQSAAARQAECL
jgi:hypothetical protein